MNIIREDQEGDVVAPLASKADFLGKALKNRSFPPSSFSSLKQHASLWLLFNAYWIHVIFL